MNDLLWTVLVCGVIVALGTLACAKLGLDTVAQMAAMLW